MLSERNLPGFQTRMRLNEDEQQCRYFIAAKMSIEEREKLYFPIFYEITNIFPKAVLELVIVKGVYLNRITLNSNSTSSRCPSFGR